MQSRDSQTYVPAKIYRSAMGVTCKMRRQSITTDGMHDDRVISNFCLASRAYRKVYLVSKRTNSRKLSSRPVYRSGAHANWVNKFNLAPFADAYLKSCRCRPN